VSGRRWRLQRCAERTPCLRSPGSGSLVSARAECPRSPRWARRYGSMRCPEHPLSLPRNRRFTGTSSGPTFQVKATAARRPRPSAQPPDGGQGRAAGASSQGCVPFVPPTAGRSPLSPGLAETHGPHPALGASRAVRRSRLSPVGSAESMGQVKTTVPGIPDSRIQAETTSPDGWSVTHAHHRMKVSAHPRRARTGIHDERRRTGHTRSWSRRGRH